MSCNEIARLIDELVDGTLDPARASGVRGHARGCTACAARLAETEALVTGMSRLEPMDPPSSLWAGVRAELDRAEATDAARPRFWWWWQGARKQLAWGGALVAATSLCIGVWVWKRGGEPGDDPGATRTPGNSTERSPATPAEVAPTAPVAPTDPIDDAVAEIQRAEADYQHAIGDLERLVASEKPRWPAAAAAAYDENLASIDAAVERQRAAFRTHPQDLAALDALHASYRKRIDFLQEAVVRGGAAGEKESL